MMIFCVKNCGNLEIIILNFSEAIKSTPLDIISVSYIVNCYPIKMTIINNMINYWSRLTNGKSIATGLCSVPENASY